MFCEDYSIPRGDKGSIQGEGSDRGKGKGYHGEGFNVEREVSGRVSRGRLCGKGVLGRLSGETTQMRRWDLGGDVSEEPPVQAHRSRYVQGKDSLLPCLSGSQMLTLERRPDAGW